MMTKDEQSWLEWTRSAKEWAERNGVKLTHAIFGPVVEDSYMRALMSAYHSENEHFSNSRIMDVEVGIADHIAGYRGLLVLDCSNGENYD